MRRVHEKSLDLNLLRALAFLLEERHVARAAERYALSPSAMSRVLGRLRRAFDDELLVPVTGGYALTPRARRLEGELAALLRRADALVTEERFDPATATGALRLHATDYSSTVILPPVLREVVARAPGLEVTVEPLGPRTTDDLQHARIDLALTPVRGPADLRWAQLYGESYVGVVAAGGPIDVERLSLSDLARWPAVTVTALAPASMIAEHRLRQLGVEAPTVLQVPYFSAALSVLPGSSLVALVPARLASLHIDDTALRFLPAPPELGPFWYGMTWHPRSDGWGAHVWLRSLLASAGEVLQGSRLSLAPPSRMSDGCSATTEITSPAP